MISVGTALEAQSVRGSAVAGTACCKILPGQFEREVRQWFVQLYKHPPRRGPRNNQQQRREEAAGFSLKESNETRVARSTDPDLQFRVQDTIPVFSAPPDCTSSPPTCPLFDQELLRGWLDSLQWRIRPFSVARVSAEEERGLFGAWN